MARSSAQIGGAVQRMNQGPTDGGQFVDWFNQRTGVPIVDRLRVEAVRSTNQIDRYTSLSGSLVH
jgi:hypothetical protein